MPTEMTRKQIIVEAAARLFSDKGFKDTSIAELAAATGVAEGTIFYHFKTKEHLLVHILEELHEQIGAEIEEFHQRETTASGLDRVEETISFYLYLATKMEDRFLLLHRHYPHRLAETNPVCRTSLEEIYSGIIDTFERAIVAGQQDGTICPRSARKLALLVFTMVDGLVRFRHFNLYDASALHGEMISACRRMLQPRSEEDTCTR
jgi:AcrR family transcriptional regulator